MLYCPMETFPYQIVYGLSQAVLYVLKQVIHMLQPDGEADGSVRHIHQLALPVGEVSENGAGGMNGQRPVVKQVGCTAYKPQFVDEAKTLLAALQVDGHLCTIEIDCV